MFWPHFFLSFCCWLLVVLPNYFVLLLWFTISPYSFALLCCFDVVSCCITLLSHLVAPPCYVTLLFHLTTSPCYIALLLHPIVLPCGITLPICLVASLCYFPLWLRLIALPYYCCFVSFCWIPLLHHLSIVKYIFGPCCSTLLIASLYLLFCTLVLLNQCSLLENMKETSCVIWWTIFIHHY
jgi:hypothetical protein